MCKNFLHTLTLVHILIIQCSSFSEFISHISACLTLEEYLDEEGLSYIGIKDVTPDFCLGFLKLLATAKNSVAKYHDGRTINEGCAHHHQAVWNGALNRAVRGGLIIGNPMKALDKREKFQPGNGDEREYLTIEELRKLMDTHCTNEQVKKAFIFACFAGLRLSDVRSLSWNKIFKTPDGEALYVHTMMLKTQKIVNVPLSNEALRALKRKKIQMSCCFSSQQVTQQSTIISRSGLRRLR